jgi:hypothetical protein
MLTKERAITLAQRSANHVNRPMAVLNLNPFSPLYIIRERDNKYEDDRELVAKINPMPTIEHGR